MTLTGTPSASLVFTHQDTYGIIKAWGRTWKKISHNKRFKKLNFCQFT